MTIGIHISSKEKPTIGVEKNEKGEYVVEFIGGFRLIAHWDEPTIENRRYFGAIGFTEEELGYMRDGISFFELLKIRSEQRKKQITERLREKGGK